MNKLNESSKFWVDAVGDNENNVQLGSYPFPSYLMRNSIDPASSNVAIGEVEGEHDKLKLLIQLELVVECQLLRINFLEMAVEELSQVGRPRTN
jgi:hypothetical protein